VLGVDLGTSTCAVGLMRDIPEILLSAQGEYATPSDIFWSNGQFIVGGPVQKLASRCPACGITDVKRMLGHRLEDTEFARWRRCWPYHVMFRMVLTINSDCFPKQHYPVGLCSGDVMCFL
jgi:molecular chaperone DnaK